VDEQEALVEQGSDIIKEKVREPEKIVTRHFVRELRLLFDI